MEDKINDELNDDCLNNLYCSESEWLLLWMMAITQTSGTITQTSGARVYLAIKAKDKILSSKHVVYNHAVMPYKQAAEYGGL